LKKNPFLSQITPPSHPCTCQWVYGWCGSSLVVQSLLQKPRIKLTQFVNARVSSIQPVTRAKVVLRGTNAHVRIVSACLQQTHPWDTSNTDYIPCKNRQINSSTVNNNCKNNC